MGHDWILDVLKDLRTFASANGMPSLAAQLDDTEIVARVEIASQSDGKKIGLLGTSSAAADRPHRTVGVR